MSEHQPLAQPQPPQDQPKKKGVFGRLDGFLEGWINGWNPYRPDKLRGKGLKPVEIEESNIKKTTAVWFLVFFGAFMAWAFLAPIDAGVVLDGTVSVLGNRKQVQHPSGGIVQEILVKEGAEVKQGEVLIRVNPLKSEAEMSGAELTYINLLATESRLKAERDAIGSIRWADELEKRFGSKDTRVNEAKNLQVQLFNSRRAEYSSQVSSLNEQITGMNAMLRSKQSAIKTIDEEMRNTKSLAKDGFVPQMAANQAERTKIDLDSSIASAQSDIARARLQISQLRTAFVKDIDDKLQDLQKNKDPVLARLESVKFDRDLAEVKAPVSGSVVGLKVFTVGGTITGGQVLMEVVPKDENLIIQLKIPASIIDKVSIGLPTDMRFTSFNVDTTPTIPGLVTMVGADKEPAPAGGGADAEFYAGQAQVTKEGLVLLGALKVQPGMSVQVLVKSGERSFMSYLMKPISDKASRAFKQ